MIDVRHFFGSVPAMSRVGIVAPVLAAVSCVASAAPTEPSPSLNLSRPSGDECKSANGEEVVVCAERGRQSPYRIDPVVLAAMRAKEATENPARVQDRSGGKEPCGTVRNECSGGTIPLLAPALLALKVAVQALKGEDWREPLRTGPNDYELFEQSKARRENEPE